MQILAVKSGDEMVLMTTRGTPLAPLDLLSDAAERRVAKGFSAEDVKRQFEEVEEVIQTIAESLGKAIQNVPRYEEATLEFGLKVGGKMGIPFVTEGSAEANFKITVKWKSQGDAMPDVRE